MTTGFCNSVAHAVLHFLPHLSFSCSSQRDLPHTLTDALPAHINASRLLLIKFSAEFIHTDGDFVIESLLLQCISMVDGI
jgi:hypothetical protein